MNITKKIRTTFVAAAVSVAPLALAQTDNPDATLLEGLQNSDDYTVLLELLDAAGLADTFAGGDEYTLLAPDDEVFEDLDPALLESLTANPEALATILQAHVLEGRYGVNDLQDLDDEGLESLQGEALNFNTTLGGLTVNGAGFDSDDVGVTYSNGVLHEIEDIILPRSLQATGALDALLIVPVDTTEDNMNSEDEAVEAEDVALEGEAPDAGALDPLTEEDDEATDVADADEVDVALEAEDEPDSDALDPLTDVTTAENLITFLIEDGRFSELVAALGEVDLSGVDEFTLFAPTDDAFAAVDASTLEDVEMDTLLLYHALPERVMQENLVGDEEDNTTAEPGERLDGLATTLEGRDLLLTLNEDGSYTLNDEAATIVEANLMPSEDAPFVVHAIDAVLIPQDAEE